jgi:NAD-dependent DNA ligase
VHKRTRATELKPSSEETFKNLHHGTKVAFPKLQIALSIRAIGETNHQLRGAQFETILL